MTGSSHRLTRRAALSGLCLAACNLRSAQASPGTEDAYIRGVSASERQRILQLGREFRQRFDLPAVSVAISFRGKLKLLACFGQVNRQQGVAALPRHRFRIASISKPITSATVLRLAEQGRVELSDTVFTPGGPLERFVPENLSSQTLAKLHNVRVRHLLSHTAGGWSNRGRDPMFVPEALGLDHESLIRWTLQNQPLTAEPGTRFSYSNFGYCLLGRLIETISEQTYEQACVQRLLGPAGCRSAAIGRRTQQERQPDEAVYYDKHDPYGKNMDVCRMDAHGGWIARPADLVRFAQRVDGFPQPPDLLSAASISTMTRPSAASGHYALGWATNRSHNWWHTGSFNGGSGILARIHDGHCWAVLVNTRSHDPTYNAALDRFPWDVRKTVKAWGSHDLFDIT